MGVAKEGEFGPETAAAGIAAITLAVLPVFLLGAVADQVSAALDLGPGEVGVAASAFFASSAVFSILGGRLSEKVGARRAMRLAAGVSGLGLVVMGFGAESLGMLVVGLGVAGAGSGLASPASNLAFARGLPVGREGSYFGIKEAAAPFAALLAGLALPTLGVTVGWRGTFEWFVPRVAVVWIMSRGVVQMEGRGDGRGVASREGSTPVLLLACGAGCCAAGTNAMGVLRNSDGEGRSVDALGGGSVSGRECGGCCGAYCGWSAC